MSQAAGGWDNAGLVAITSWNAMHVSRRSLEVKGFCAWCSATQDRPPRSGCAHPDMPPYP